MLRLSEIRKFTSFGELLDSSEFPGFRLPVMLYSNLLSRGFRKRGVLFHPLFCLCLDHSRESMQRHEMIDPLISVTIIGVVQLSLH